MPPAYHVLYVDGGANRHTTNGHYPGIDGRFTVDGASSGSEAIRCIETGHYDAVVSVLQMPDMNAITLIEKVRKYNTALPVILVTGPGRDEKVIDAIETGAVFYFRKDGDPEEQDRGLSDTILAVIKRQLSDSALNVCEERLVTLIDQSPFSIQIFSPDGQTIQVNQAFEELWGVTFGELKEYNVLNDKELVRLGVMPHIRKGFSGEAVTLPAVQYDTRESLGTGRKKWVTGHIYPVRSAGGTIREVILTHEDITERRLVEEALRGSDEKYRFIQEAVNDGIWDWNIPDGSVLFSPRWFSMLGYEPGEMPETYITWRSLIHPDDAGPAEKKIHDHIRGKDERYAIEFRMRTKEGNWRWILARGQVVERDAGGNPVRMVGTHTDIDERKRAELELARKSEELSVSYEQLAASEKELRDTLEEQKRQELALRESEARLSLTLEVGNAGMWEWNLDTDEVRFNDRFHALLGYRQGDLPATLKEWQAYHHPDDFPALISRAEAYFRGDTPVYESEHRIRTKTGEWNWIFTRGRLVSRIQPGSKGWFVGLALNTTAWKRIESELEQKNQELMASYEQLTASEEELKDQFDALAESEHTLRLSEGRLTMAQEIGHTGGWEYYIDAKIMWASAEGARIFGLPGVAGEIPMEDIERCIPEHDRVHQALVDLIGGNAEYNLEYAINPADGSLRKMIHSVARVEKDRTGRPVKVMGVIQDITERKRAEDTIMRVNRKLNILNDLTRRDLINQVFVLKSYLALAMAAATGNETVLKSLQKTEPVLRSITEITEFTKDYQNMGESPPRWQNVKLAFLFAISHLSLGDIRHSLETGDLEIYADPQLEKAFQRLFENIIGHWGPATYIRVSCKKISGEVVIVIESDGRGIPKERKDRIFLHGEGSCASGQGLFFVQEILDLTGITIWETGEPAAGTRFEISVPDGMYRISRIQ
jgi:PAS domain S-box-containing protein